MGIKCYCLALGITGSQEGKYALLARFQAIIGGRPVPYFFLAFVIKGAGGDKVQRVGFCVLYYTDNPFLRLPGLVLHSF